MRTNFGHLAFDGREYIDAPNYPVSRSWAQGYGYTDNSRRTPLMAQTAMRAYFQPSGDPVTFDLKEVNIPLQAYGEEPAATTPAATTPPAEQQQQQGGQWDALINTVMKGVTTVAVGAYDASQQRKAAQAEAARADAAARQAAALQTVQGSGGGGGTGSGTTIAIVAVLGIAALGAVYFFSKSDGE